MLLTRRRPLSTIALTPTNRSTPSPIGSLRGIEDIDRYMPELPMAGIRRGNAIYNTDTQPSVPPGLIIPPRLPPRAVSRSRSYNENSAGLSTPNHLYIPLPQLASTTPNMKQPQETDGNEGGNVTRCPSAPKPSSLANEDVGDKDKDTGIGVRGICDVEAEAEGAMEGGDRDGVHGVPKLWPASGAKIGVR